MTPALPLGNAAGVALKVLGDHPTRSTPTGIANGPRGRMGFDPAETHDGLVELRGRGLAFERSGRWTLTDRGRKLAGRAG
jgi:hypothetical protein